MALCSRVMCQGVVDRLALLAKVAMGCGDSTQGSSLPECASCILTALYDQLQAHARMGTPSGIGISQ